MIEAARLRIEAKRCRRLAEYVSSDQDQAMFRRVAKDFDEAAAELEKKTSLYPVSIPSGHCSARLDSGDEPVHDGRRRRTVAPA